MKRIITLIVILFSTQLFSQSTFVKTYGNAQSDFGTSCVEAYDHGIILAVSTATNGMNIQTGLVRTDVNGLNLWSKNKQVGNYCFPQTVVETLDSGIIVFGAGNYNPTINGNDDFLFIFKTDSIGNDIWSKEYRLSQNDRPVKLIKAKSGGFIFCSVGDYNLGFYPNASIVRLEEDGSIRWSKKMELPYGLLPTSLVEMPDGKICFAGTTVSYSPIFFNDVVVCALDSNGVEDWSKVFQTYYDDDCNLLLTNSSGELFLSGRTYVVSGNMWDVFNLKLNSTGDIMYQKVYDAGTADGEIMRTGIGFDDGSSLLLGDIGTFDERDITMMRINNDGSIRWTRKYPFSPLFTNYPYDIFRTYDNSFMFTGDVRPPTYYRDAVLVKTRDDGFIQCNLDTVYFSTVNDTFTEIIPNFVASDNLITPVDSIVNAPFNIITEKITCQQIFPIPDFTYEEDTICSSQCIRFIDKTLNQPTSWLWTFSGADSTVSYVQNPEGICFFSRGNFTVILEATNQFGTASITKNISIGSECPEEPFIIPNVFTPNNDGKNDIFEIENLPEGSTMKIYSRWGNEIFTSTPKKQFWNGLDKNGKKASDGVYFYVLQIPGSRYNGTVQLISGN